MSIFRPSVRVTAPDGTAWEIYAYRLQLPATRTGAPARPGAPGRRVGPIGAATSLLGGLARLLALVLWHAPRAWIGLWTSDTWTVEAVSWNVKRTSLAWRTTSEYRGHVLAQIEGQLARGEVPKVQHADFLGETGSGY